MDSVPNTAETILDEKQTMPKFSPNVLGAAYAVVSMFAYAIVVTIGSRLVETYNPLQVVWVLFLVTFLLIVPYGAITKRQILPRSGFHLHALRGLLGFSSMVLYLVSTLFLGLAEATALSFTAPLFLIFFAILFLKEPIRWRRWTATTIGFVGVFIMCNPTNLIAAAAGTGNADWKLLVGIMIGLFSAFLWAGALTIMKRLSENDSAVALGFSFCLMGLIFSTIPAIAVWQTPSMQDFGLMIGMGVAHTIAQQFMLAAYAKGEATYVAPYFFTRLPFTFVLGFIFLGQVPHISVIIGAPIVFLATLYVTFREMQLQTARNILMRMRNYKQEKQQERQRIIMEASIQSLDWDPAPAGPLSFTENETTQPSKARIW